MKAFNWFINSWNISFTRSMFIFWNWHLSKINKWFNMPKALAHIWYLKFVMSMFGGLFTGHNCLSWTSLPLLHWQYCYTEFWFTMLLSKLVSFLSFSDGWCFAVFFQVRNKSEGAARVYKESEKVTGLKFCLVNVLHFYG